MLGVVIWDLLPEAWGLSPIYTLAGFLSGALFILFLRQEESTNRDGTTDVRFTRTGLLLGMGIAVHNFPEGLAVGTVFANDPSSPLWWELSLLMGIHNIPEGLAVATTLRLGNTGWRSIALILFLAEIPMAIGALFGGILGLITTPWVATSLGFAGGAMLVLVAVELTPLASRQAGWWWTTIGLSTGLGLARLLSLLLS
jgi:ZIP family zinc transporter